MLSVRSVLTALALLLTPASAALAQDTAPVPAAPGETYVFVAVDSYDLQGEPLHAYYTTDRGVVTVRGLVQGESTPRAISFKSSFLGQEHRTFERCDRFALLMMSKPGQYQLEVRQEGDEWAHYVGCKLTRNP